MRGTGFPIAMFLLLGPAVPGLAQTCLLPSQKPMIEIELYFGRDIEGRGIVSNGQWSKFASDILATDFPDGFTVTDASGAWRDPKSGRVLREPSKVVSAIVEPSSGLKARISDAAGTYRTRFHQQSVGVVTRVVCAAF